MQLFNEIEKGFKRIVLLVDTYFSRRCIVLFKNNAKTFDFEIIDNLKSLRKFLVNGRPRFQNAYSKFFIFKTEAFLTI